MIPIDSIGGRETVVVLLRTRCCCPPREKVHPFVCGSVASTVAATASNIISKFRTTTVSAVSDGLMEVPVPANHSIMGHDGIDG